MAEGSIFEGMRDLSSKQKEGFEHIEAFTESLQRISSASEIIKEQEEKLQTYLTKLDNAKVAMLEIMNRTQTVQLKLNNIRQLYTPQSKALVQEGPSPISVCTRVECDTGTTHERMQLSSTCQSSSARWY